MKDPLDSILIVSSREYLLQNKLARPSHNRRLVPKVRMLKKDPVILLMDTNRVFDAPNGPILRGELGVKVADIPLAVTPKPEAVGHVPGAVLAEVKGVLSLVGVVRIATVTMLAERPPNRGENLGLSDYGTTISAKERR